jgi:hypothetical protein
LYELLLRALGPLYEPFVKPEYELLRRVLPLYVFDERDEAAGAVRLDTALDERETPAVAERVADVPAEREVTAFEERVPIELLLLLRVETVEAERADAVLRLPYVRLSVVAAERAETPDLPDIEEACVSRAFVLPLLRAENVFSGCAVA